MSSPTNSSILVHKNETEADRVVSPRVSRGGALVWYGLLVLAMVAGVVAFIIRAKEGLASTGLTTITPWGTWVAFYIYFVGMSAGAFLLSTFIHVFGMERFHKVGREALLVAIISMVLALTFILLDLGRMERFWHVLWYFNPTSVLAWEVRFYVIYILLLAAELYFSMRQDLIRASRGTGWAARVAAVCTLGSKDLSEESVKRDHRILKVLGAIGIPIAIFGVHGGTGALFAVAKARPYLNSALLPVVFIVSALVSGTALLIASYTIRKKVSGQIPDREMLKSLGGLLALFLSIDLGLEFYEFLIGAYGLEATELATLKTIFAGQFAWSFWGIQMLVGAVIPLAILAYPRTRNSPAAIAAAAIMVVIGIVAVRFHIVLPSLIVPVMEGLPEGYYLPTWVELASSLGVIAFGLFLYSLAVTGLPIDVRQEIDKGVKENE
ncbi:NrfD/PsrC family molybdoenzyme membrane anchor subunit [Calderihabitans maritimus]|uniref:Molybdopterin oxidoreductase membrane subunit n=1 Tax=Calderihabitans maritimus TaxID=1246530 RepID=A0A1Z5HRR1_9FIRM|nr:NrfD/PsrC family molybdoenzyme membrane anchor subunit [Calderihabitans maritimus]GAW92015.1 molybdopterin oxidoreductase membrane subunit [Calderihabitans maritimus]